MAIPEHLPPQTRKQLAEVGWTKGLELAKLTRRDWQYKQVRSHSGHDSEESLIKLCVCCRGEIYVPREVASP